LLNTAYDTDKNNSLLINNYAAILLDLHRDSKALELLKKGCPEFSEYCFNFAIAIAKSAYDVEQIRKWNQSANEKPKRDGAIIAYMDWQAL